MARHVSRAWRGGVAVSAVLFAVSDIIWHEAWSSPAFATVFGVVPHGLFDACWLFVALVFTVDLWRPRWLNARRWMVVASTLWATIAAVFAASIGWTTATGATSAFGSAVVWALVSWLSWEHVRVYRR